MAKNIFGIFIFFLIASSVSGQGIFSTTKGHVEFFSSAPLEDIKATNSSVKVLFNSANGELNVRMFIKDFQFKKALMQKHFNEEYLESHLYPEARLIGKIQQYNREKISSKPLAVVVEGKMTIHGVTKDFSTSGTITQKGKKIMCETKFPIRLADYNVKIPKIFIKNIAELVDVTVKLELE
jgi:polyisoprenoid-binding protein YceI